MSEFEIERFLDLSKAVRLSPSQLEAVRRAGLTPGEQRIIAYMADTERHTILYMRDLLAGHSARDPEITAFLSAWVYEELYHGRALQQVLEATGMPPDPERFRKVTEGALIQEIVEATLSHAAAMLTPRFIAVHMAWGAINELTASVAYLALAERTRNPGLAELVNEIAKQERKHFAFYYQQAKKRLRDEPKTQALVRFAMKRFWSVVGSGVGGLGNLGYFAAALFDDEVGRAKLRKVEDTIRELPGLEWFDLLTIQVAKLAAEFKSKNVLPADPFAFELATSGAEPQRERRGIRPELLKSFH